MNDAGRGGPRRASRPRALWTLGVFSLALFWVPLVAPLVQAATLAAVVRARRRGTAALPSLAFGAAAAVAGFLLFLAAQYLWIV